MKGMMTNIRCIFNGLCRPAGATGSFDIIKSIVAKASVLLASVALFACSSPQLSQQTLWTNSPSIDRLVGLGSGMALAAEETEVADGAFRVGDKVVLLGRNLRNCRVTINGKTVPSVSYLKSQELKSLNRVPVVSRAELAGRAHSADTVNKASGSAGLPSGGQVSLATSGIMFQLPEGVKTDGENVLKLVTPHGEVTFQIPFVELVSVR
jgi:hypothetical protein